MVQLDIDLTKLNEEELKAYELLKKKVESAEEEKPSELITLLDEDFPVLPGLKKKEGIKVTVPYKPKSKPEKAKPKKQIVDRTDIGSVVIIRHPKIPQGTKDKWFEKTREIMKEKKVSFRAAFEQASCGKSPRRYYLEYKEYWRRKGKAHLVREKPRANPYLHDKSEFEKFRSEQIGKVMKYHKLNIEEAEKYLKAQWKVDPRQAVERVNLELVKRGDIDIESIKPRPEFPAIKAVRSPYKQKMLIDILESLINNPDQFLEQEKHGYLLGVEDYEQWVQMCQQLAVNFKKIAEHFGVKNHFKLVGMGSKVLSIKYDGVRIK